MSNAVKARKKHGYSSSIDHLPNELLINVFQRMSRKSVFSGKCVCKRWLSLLSDPKFVIAYLNNRRYKLRKLQQWTFIMVTRDCLRSDTASPMCTRHYVYSKSHEFRHEGFLLEFMPYQTQVAATFKDLVLCYSIDQIKRQRVYYICNPLTMKWVALPPSPLLPYEEDSRAYLICEEPFYRNDKDDHQIITGVNLEYKFRVVVVHSFPEKLESISYDPLSTFSLIVFCSESGCWREITLVAPTPGGYDGGYFWHPVFQGVVCKGLLCLRNFMKFGIFDPFEITCSSNSSLRAISPRLGLRGNLVECGGRLLDIAHNKYLRRITMSRMLLQDENTKVSALTWNVMYREYITGKLMGDTRGLSIGVHPTKANLVYVLMMHDNQMVCCDVKLGSLKPLEFWVPGYFEAAHRLELQWWPTPIPLLKICTRNQNGD